MQGLAGSQRLAYGFTVTTANEQNFNCVMVGRCLSVLMRTASETKREEIKGCKAECFMAKN